MLRAMLDAHVDTWDMLQHAGQPVLPDLYTTDDLLLLATDLKAHGGELYGKNLLRCLNSGSFTPDDYYRRRPGMDATFIDLTSKPNIGQIRDAVMEYASAATRASVRISDDDPYELFVTHAKGAEIVSLDVQGAAVRYSPASVASTNRETAGAFLDNIQAVRALLTTGHPD